MNKINFNDMRINDLSTVTLYKSKTLYLYVCKLNYNNKDHLYYMGNSCNLTYDSLNTATELKYPSEFAESKVTQLY